jgi:hypothetical protein
MEDQKRYDDLMDGNRFTLAVYRRLEFAVGHRPVPVEIDLVPPTLTCDRPSPAVTGKGDGCRARPRRCGARTTPTIGY